MLINHEKFYIKNATNIILGIDIELIQSGGCGRSPKIEKFMPSENKSLST